jgi:hypothetical protein
VPVEPLRLQKRRIHAEPAPAANPCQNATQTAVGGPSAPAKIDAIVLSAIYREADQDPDFLRPSDMRGIRLILDYLKPQTLLTEHDVAHNLPPGMHCRRAAQVDIDWPPAAKRTRPFALAR